MVVSKESAMNKCPNWRLKNGHCVTCGVKCFDIRIAVIESPKTSPNLSASSKKKRMLLKKLLLNNYNSNQKKESSAVTTEVKTPITCYEKNVVDGYCLNCNIPSYDTEAQEYGERGDVTIAGNQTSSSDEHDSSSVNVNNIQQYIVTATVESVDSLNIKRLEDSEDYVVIGPGGRITEHGTSTSKSSRFVPPERISAPPQSGKAVANEQSAQPMPSLILSTRHTPDHEMIPATIMTTERPSTDSPLVAMHEEELSMVTPSSAVETVFPEGIYVGPLHETTGNPHGMNGIMRFNDGSVYNGSWENGHMNGTGTCRYLDGGVYSGEWKRGQMHGEGKFVFANACQYTGRWRNGKMDGKGTYLFIGNGNNEKYQGEWKRNQPEGQGTFTYKSGNIYEGQWSKGKRDGNGIFKYSNGDEYIGEWSVDRKNGIGIYRWDSSHVEFGGCLDIKSYLDDEAQEGVRWSPDQTRTFRLVSGCEVGEISKSEADQFKENASMISPFIFMALMQYF